MPPVSMAITVKLYVLTAEVVKVRVGLLLKLRNKEVPAMNLYCTDIPPTGVAAKVIGVPTATVLAGVTAKLTADKVGITTKFFAADVTVVASGLGLLASMAITVNTCVPAGGVQTNTLLLEKSLIIALPSMNLYCTAAPLVAVAVNVTCLPAIIGPATDVARETAVNADLIFRVTIGEVTVKLGSIPLVSRAITVKL